MLYISYLRHIYNQNVQDDLAYHRIEKKINEKKKKMQEMPYI